jgi:hypothetical protein
MIFSFEQNTCKISQSTWLIVKYCMKGTGARKMNIPKAQKKLSKRRKMGGSLKKL